MKFSLGQPKTLSMADDFCDTMDAEGIGFFLRIFGGL